MSDDEKKTIFPKFVTAELVSQVVDLVLKAVMFGDSPLCKLLKRQACHIRVVVPCIEPKPNEDRGRLPIMPDAIYERSVGAKDAWSAPYDDIGGGKALQLWSGQNDDRTDIMPHLLFTGDTPCWGGVRRAGIIVSCSGVQPWFDKMISGMIADMIIGLAYDAWMTSQDKKDHVDFLT
jgi:hypothetical protein